MTTVISEINGTNEQLNQPMTDSINSAFINIYIYTSHYLHNNYDKPTSYATTSYKYNIRYI